MEPKQENTQQQPLGTPSQQPVVPQQQQQQQQQQQHQPQIQNQNQNANLNPRATTWQFGLFDCFADLEGSLVACFLPCILHGKTMDRMRDPSLQSHDPINNECIIWGGIQCFTCCGWLYNMMKRTEIRERYGIQGSGGSDCCTSYCCLCCALVQQDREVALRAGHYAPVTQGYQAHTQGMQMPAPVPVPVPAPAPVHQQSFQGQTQAYQQSPSQQAYQQSSPPPQQLYQQSPPPPPQQQQQQHPMQSGIQSVNEQNMPAYPHDGQYGQKQ